MCKAERQLLLLLSSLFYRPDVNAITCASSPVLAKRLHKRFTVTIIALQRCLQLGLTLIQLLFDFNSMSDQPQPDSHWSASKPCYDLRYDYRPTWPVCGLLYWGL